MNYATERLLAAAKATLSLLESEGRGHHVASEELEAAIFYFDAHGDKPEPLRVLVALEGGIVQGAVADRPGVSVITLDYDTEGADADRVFAIPQDDGGTSAAYVGGHSATNDPAFIDGVENAKLDDPQEAIEQLRWQAEAWSKDETSDVIRRMGEEAAAKVAELEAQLASEAA